MHVGFDVHDARSLSLSPISFFPAPGSTGRTSAFYSRDVVVVAKDGSRAKLTVYGDTEDSLMTDEEKQQAADRDADAADHEAEEARRVHEERHGQGCLSDQGALNGAASRACEVNEGPPPF